MDSIPTAVTGGRARATTALLTALLLAGPLLAGPWGGVAAAGPEDNVAPPAEAPPADAPSTAGAPAPVDVVEPRKELEFHNDALIERADGTIAYFYRTNFITPKDLMAALTASGFDKLLSVGTNRASATQPMQQVERQNVLVIEGEPEAIEMVLDAIAYFDVAAPQVFVEAKVIEVTYDSNFEVGLDYTWDRSTVGPQTFFRGATSILNPPTFLSSGYPPSFPFQGTGVGFGFVGNTAERFGAFDMQLQAMQMSGKAEVLSKPSIIATQGIEAQVTTSEDRPVVTLQSANRGGETFNTSSVRSGVSLRVKPTHIGEAFVTLEIEPKVEGLAGLATNTPGGTFSPIKTTRTAKTTVTLGNGETLVIGGLYTNGSTIEKARTPFLSDLPLLGELFTRTRETKAKTELIFILTPTIVRKTKDLKIVVPPAELERLETVESKKDSDCDCPPKPPQLPPPPGWGARFLDE
jgi:type II secretory pathway component GspD/PulD (secretin)